MPAQKGANKSQHDTKALEKSLTLRKGREVTEQSAPLDHQLYTKQSELQRPKPISEIICQGLRPHPGPDGLTDGANALPQLVASSEAPVDYDNQSDDVAEEIVLDCINITNLSTNKEAALARGADILMVQEQAGTQVGYM